MEYTYIYSLSDPMTGEIRYIGKTYNELKKRLHSHIMECKTDRKTHKINWIKSLLSNNKKPIISTIDIVPKSDWEYWEKYWIEQFKQWGFNLTNMTVCGYDNSYNLRLGKETKQKIRVSKLRTTLSNEHTYNMRKAVNNEEYYLEKFIKKASARHSGKYDYSKVCYVNSIEKVEVVCPMHGSFFVRPDAHIRKVGCPKCNGGGKDSAEDFKEKAIRKHDGKYDYSKSDYVNSGTKVEVICKAHGLFSITPRNHLAGQGCPKCAGVYKKTKEEFLEECSAVHLGKYDYSMVQYAGGKNKIAIVCPNHGEFSQNAKDHIRGHGCPKCSASKGERLVAGIFENLGLKFEENYAFKDCRGISGGILPFDFYIPSKKMVIEFDGRQHFEPVEIFGGGGAYDAQLKNDKIRNLWCAENGIKIIRIKYDEVEKGLKSLYSELVGERPFGGDKIDPSEFSLESFLSLREEMVSYVAGFGSSVQRHSIGDFACDVFSEEAGVGFRMLGIWKDCEINADKNNAKMAQDAYEKSGYKIVHIYEDAWKAKKDIIKSRIKNILGKNEKIWARKCIIKNVETAEARAFMSGSHIQGNVGASYKIGLYFDGELVALMTFGPLRKNLGQKSKERSWELLRFCNKKDTSVVGGASRLFSHFIKEKDPEYIVSYADKCWSTKSNIYGELGMKYVHESKPSYFYIVGESRKGRFGYRKDVLVKMGFDRDMSEHEICRSVGVYRIYDCGAIKYAYEKSDSGK